MMKPRNTDSVFRKVMWFDNRQRFHIDYFDMLLPKRRVSDQQRYKSGVYYSEKCKRDIQYESGRELKFIHILEKSKKVRFYFEQPAKVPYWRGKVKRYYYPDFGVYLTTGEFVIVEIKELASMLEDRVQVKMEGLMEFCARKGFGLLLTDGLHTIDDLKKTKLNRKLEKEILQALQEGPIRKTQYTAILNRSGSSHTDLFRIILKHDLYYTAFPFKLKKGGFNPEFRERMVFSRGPN